MECDDSSHCTGLAWDPDGDVLAISSDQNSHVILWDTTMNRTIDLDVGLREPITAIQWSASAKLAVGSAKGNLQVYKCSQFLLLVLRDKPAIRKIKCFNETESEYIR